MSNDNREFTNYLTLSNESQKFNNYNTLYENILAKKNMQDTISEYSNRKFILKGNIIEYLKHISNSSQKKQLSFESRKPKIKGNIKNNLLKKILYNDKKIFKKRVFEPFHISLQNLISNKRKSNILNRNNYEHRFSLSYNSLKHSRQTNGFSQTDSTHFSLSSSRKSKIARIKHNKRAITIDNYIKTISSINNITPRITNNNIKEKKVHRENIITKVDKYPLKKGALLTERDYDLYYPIFKKNNEKCKEELNFYKSKKEFHHFVDNYFKILDKKISNIYKSNLKALKHSLKNTCLHFRLASYENNNLLNYIKNENRKFNIINKNIEKDKDPNEGNNIKMKLNKDIQDIFQLMKKNNNISRKKLILKKYKEIMFIDAIHFMKFNISINKFYIILNLRDNKMGYLDVDKYNNNDKNLMNKLLIEEIFTMNNTLKQIFETSPSKIRISIKNEFTFLLNCIKESEVAKVKELVKENRALILAHDTFGQTALHWIAKRNVYELIEDVLQLGGFIHSQDSVSRTPLHYAVSSDCRETAVYLLFNFANPYIKDTFGKNCLDLAPSFFMKKIIKHGYFLYYLHHKINRIKKETRRNELKLYLLDGIKQHYNYQSVVNLIF